MSLRAAERGPVGECFQVLPYGEKITDLLITVCLAALTQQSTYYTFQPSVVHLKLSYS